MSYWIESHQSLGRHPKVTRMASLLKIHKAQAIGHLHYLWWWSLDYAPSGDLSAFTSCELCAAAEWPGKNEEEFVNALKQTGLLDSDMMIHDWYEYAGKLIDERVRDRERKKAGRLAEKSRTSGTCPPDIHRTSTGHQPEVCRTKPNQTEQNQTEQKKERASAFSPPTIEEVKNYISSEKYPVDPQKWFDFYQSKGWMVGSNRMKDWKAAVRTWVKRDNFQRPAEQPIKSETSFQRLMRAVDEKYANSEEEK